jgi:hypothetical protein
MRGSRLLHTCWAVTSRRLDHRRGDVEVDQRPPLSLTKIANLVCEVDHTLAAGRLCGCPPGVS